MAAATHAYVPQHPLLAVSRDIATASEAIRRAVQSSLPQNGRPVSFNIELFVRDNVVTDVRWSLVHKAR